MTTNKPVVTIYETYGSGAQDIGPAVADALGVPWLTQCYSSEDLEAAEGRGDDDSWLGRLIESLGRTAATTDIGVFPGHLDALDASDAARELREQIADGGVVLGRNATRILADDPRALHVKLDGPLEQRIARGARQSGVDAARARARQSREDAARPALAQRLFGWDPRSNDHFDLVVNTGRVSTDEAVAMILACQRLHASA